MLDNGARHVTGTYFNNDQRAKDVFNELVRSYSKNRFAIIKADARTEEGNILTFSPEKENYI